MRVGSLPLRIFAVLAFAMGPSGPSDAATTPDRLAEIGASKNGAFALGPAREFALRGGLPNFFKRAKDGEKLTVVYYGTSVTRPPGWRQMSFDWLQNRFPRADLTMVDASVGGSGSIDGVFRADRDLVPHRPDLLFIEFAGNDNPDSRSRPLDVLRAVEGIVRKARGANPRVDVCFVYAFGSGDFATLRAGLAPRGATLHDLVADNYNLPSLHMSMEVARLEQAGKLVNHAPATPTGLTDDGKIIFTNDGSHPTIPAGHRVWADRVIAGLEALEKISPPLSPELPEPLMADHWAAAKTLPARGLARFSGQWQRLTRETGPSAAVEGISIYDWIPQLMRTVEPGAFVKVRFKGSVVGLRGVTGPDSGVIEVTVDGKAAERQAQFTGYSHSVRYGGKPLSTLAWGEHTVRWTLTGERIDKRAVLDGDKRRPRGQDVLDHPEKYAEHSLSAGEILLVGEILPVGDAIPQAESAASPPSTIGGAEDACPSAYRAAIGPQRWQKLATRLDEVNHDIATRGIRKFRDFPEPMLTGYAYEEFYDWDLYFESLYLSYYGKADVGLANFRAFMSIQKRNGYISRMLQRQQSKHQFKPFLAQMAVLGSQQLGGDYEWLRASYFEQLGRYLDRWFWYDNDNNGLPMWNSADSSGMDNQDSRAGKIDTFQCEGVDLACYLYRELQAMAFIAEKLGKPDDSRAYTSRATALAELINKTFWDETDGFYYDRSERTGKPIKVKTVTGFIPLWAGIASPQQAERLVREHLTNEKEFWLKYPVATYAATEPDFYQGVRKKECNWRGPAWIPTNYMIMHGLVDYGYKDVARELADRTFRLVLDENSTTREFYDSDTGRGNGMNPFWGWSALGYVMPLELATGTNPMKFETGPRPLLSQNLDVSWPTDR